MNNTLQSIYYKSSICVAFKEYHWNCIEMYIYNEKNLSISNIFINRGGDDSISPGEWEVY